MSSHYDKILHRKLDAIFERCNGTLDCIYAYTFPTTAEIYRHKGLGSAFRHAVSLPAAIIFAPLIRALQSEKARVQKDQKSRLQM